MNKIEVKILDHNLNGMARFLAKLTQRGHEIGCMDDVVKLYDDSIKTAPGKSLMALPHSTIRRMNYITVAISGLSTKAVSQLRTHAKRLTFISTSTQYSSYEGKSDNYVIPAGLEKNVEKKLQTALDVAQFLYTELINEGVDKDKVGYLLPQGLRKTLIISGNLDDWRYVIQTRLCHRNTEEVQYISRLIYQAIEAIDPIYTTGMLPPCVDGACQEGKFCCGEKFHL